MENGIFTFHSHLKSKIEENICGCVSEDASQNIITENAIGLLDSATASQTAANMAAQSLDSCVKRYIIQHQQVFQAT